MKNTIKSVFALVLVTSFFSVPVFAWDEAGHKISAYIAWQHMRPEVREQVIKILLAAPEDSQISAFYTVYGTRNDEIRKREYFMFTATWADVVRDRNIATRFKNYHKGNWHYADAFWTRKDGKVEYLPAPEDGGQALDRLKEFDAMIRGRANDSQKAVAIAWLEHIIGDLHQPLHTSARVTDSTPKGDQGGNLFLLTPQGTPRDKQENLHWYWDSIVTRNFPNTKNECEANYLDPLAEAFMKNYPYEKMKSKLAEGKFEEWVKDSLTVAQNNVFSADLKQFEIPSAAYKKKAYAVAEERLTLAGYRMAAVFNSAFGVTTTAPMTAPN